MFEKIREFILEEVLQFIDKSEFSDDSNLFELGLDSLNIMRLVFFLEEEFKIKIPEDKISIENLSTVNSIQNLVKSLL